MYSIKFFSVLAFLIGSFNVTAQSKRSVLNELEQELIALMTDFDNAKSVFEDSLTSRSEQIKLRQMAIKNVTAETVTKLRTCESLQKEYETTVLKIAGSQRVKEIKTHIREQNMSLIFNYYELNNVDNQKFETFSKNDLSMLKNWEGTWIKGYCDKDSKYFLQIFKTSPEVQEDGFWKKNSWYIRSYEKCSLISNFELINFSLEITTGATKQSGNTTITKEKITLRRSRNTPYLKHESLGILEYCTEWDIK